jgi:hypothetical protein
VALEELFVDGGVLDRDNPFTTDVLGDGVDEVEGVPVAEPVEEYWNVGRHVIVWEVYRTEAPDSSPTRAPGAGSNGSLGASSSERLFPR